MGGQDRSRRGRGRGVGWMGPRADPGSPSTLSVPEGLMGGQDRCKTPSPPLRSPDPYGWPTPYLSGIDLYGQYRSNKEKRRQIA